MDIDNSELAGMIWTIWSVLQHRTVLVKTVDYCNSGKTDPMGLIFGCKNDGVNLVWTSQYVPDFRIKRKKKLQPPSLILPSRPSPR